MSFCSLASICPVLPFGQWQGPLLCWLASALGPPTFHRRQQGRLVTDTLQGGATVCGMLPAASANTGTMHAS